MSVDKENKLWKMLEKSRNRRKALSEIESLAGNVNSDNVAALREMLDKRDNKILLALVSTFKP